MRFTTPPKQTNSFSLLAALRRPVQVDGNAVHLRLHKLEWSFNKAWGCCALPMDLEDAIEILVLVADDVTADAEDAEAAGGRARPHRAVGSGTEGGSGGERGIA